MFDQLMSLRNNHKYVIHTTDYQPSDALLSRQLDKQPGKKLAVLFPPWHGARSLYLRLGKRLQKQGYSVLTYEFSPEILKADIDQVLRSFDGLASTIAIELQELTRTSEYEAIHLIGTSLGNQVLILTAARFQSFTAVTMVDPASTVSGPVWDGIRTQSIHEEFV